MSKVFRVFLSSTFDDWKAEREHLRKKVFPRLREKCEKKGGRFLSVDLRWGISEEAGRKHATVDICLDEVRRCQQVSPKPNFLVFLGNRYGWRPVPPKIKSDQWEKLKNLGVINPLFEKWYKIDENSIAKDRMLIPQTTEWEEDQKHLRYVLDKAYLSKGWNFSENDSAFLVGSIVEQEVVCGALKSKDAQDHVHVFKRNIEGEIETPFKDTLEVLGEVADWSQIQECLIKRRTSMLERRLKDLLGDSNFHQVNKGISQAWTSCKWGEGERPDRHNEAFGEDVESVLWQVIEHELEEENTKELDCNIPSTDFFSGYEDERSSIKEHDKGPLLVYGQAGSGKSTLLAKAVEEAKEDQVEVLSFWIGRDANCGTGEGLLRTMIKQLSIVFNDEVDTGQKSFKELTELLETLCLAGEGKPVKIFVDALDQLPNGDLAKEIGWILTGIPVVISTLSEEIKNSFKEKYDHHRLIILKEMGNEIAEVLLEKWLNDKGRKLGAAQKTALLNTYNGTPLHLKILFERAQHFKLKEEVPSWMMEHETTTEETIKVLYDDLAAKEKHGFEMVAGTLSYIAATPYGIPEDVLLEVLRSDNELVKSLESSKYWEETDDKIPEIVWSRLYHDLEPFLARRVVYGEVLLDFYHIQFRRVVSGCSIGDAVIKGFSQGAEVNCHSNLAVNLIHTWKRCMGNTNWWVMYEIISLLRNVKMNTELYALVEEDAFLQTQMNIDKSLVLNSINTAIEVSCEDRLPRKVIDLAYKKTLHSTAQQTTSPLDIYREEGFTKEVIANLELRDKDSKYFWLRLLYAYMLSSERSQSDAQIVKERFSLNVALNSQDTIQVLLGDIKKAVKRVEIFFEPDDLRYRAINDGLTDCSDDSVNSLAEKCLSLNSLLLQYEKFMRFIGKQKASSEFLKQHALIDPEFAYKHSVIIDNKYIQLETKRDIFLKLNKLSVPLFQDFQIFFNELNHINGAESGYKQGMYNLEYWASFKEVLIKVHPAEAKNFWDSFYNCYCRNVRLGIQIQALCEYTGLIESTKLLGLLSEEYHHIMDNPSFLAKYRKGSLFSIAEAAIDSGSLKLSLEVLKSASAIRDGYVSSEKACGIFSKLIAEGADKSEVEGLYASLNKNFSRPSVEEAKLNYLLGNECAYRSILAKCVEERHAKAISMMVELGEQTWAKEVIGKYKLQESWNADWASFLLQNGSYSEVKNMMETRSFEVDYTMVPATGDGHDFMSDLLKDGTIFKMQTGKSLEKIWTILTEYTKGDCDLLWLILPLMFRNEEWTMLGLLLMVYNDSTKKELHSYLLKKAGISL